MFHLQQSGDLVVDYDNVYTGRQLNAFSGCRIVRIDYNLLIPFPKV